MKNKITGSEYLDKKSSPLVIPLSPPSLVIPLYPPPPCFPGSLEPYLTSAYRVNYHKGGIKGGGSGKGREKNKDGGKGLVLWEGRRIKMVEKGWYCGRGEE